MTDTPQSTSEGATEQDADGQLEENVSVAPLPSIDLQSTDTSTTVEERACLYVDALISRLSGIDVEGYFQSPVEELYAPGYYNIILQPMCFDTMRRKLKGREYRTWRAFLADFDLIVNNAKKYNAQRSKVWKAAAKLQRIGKKLLLSSEFEGRRAFQLLHPEGPAAAAAEEEAAAAAAVAVAGLQQPAADVLVSPNPDVIGAGRQASGAALGLHLRVGSFDSPKLIVPRQQSVPPNGVLGSPPHSRSRTKRISCDGSDTELEDDVEVAWRETFPQPLEQVLQQHKPPCTFQPYSFRSMEFQDSLAEATDFELSGRSLEWRTERRSIEWRCRWLELRMLELQQQQQQLKLMTELLAAGDSGQAGLQGQMVGRAPVTLLPNQSVVDIENIPFFLAHAQDRLPCAAYNAPAVKQEATPVPEAPSSSTVNNVAPGAETAHFAVGAPAAQLLQLQAPKTASDRHATGDMEDASAPMDTDTVAAADGTAPASKQADPAVSVPPTHDSLPLAAYARSAEQAISGNHGSNPPHPTGGELEELHDCYPARLFAAFGLLQQQIERLRGRLQSAFNLEGAPKQNGAGRGKPQVAGAKGGARKGQLGRLGRFVPTPSNLQRGDSLASKKRRRLDDGDAPTGSGLAAAKPLERLPSVNIAIPQVREVPAEQRAARHAALTVWNSSVRAHGDAALQAPPPEVAAVLAAADEGSSSEDTSDEAYIARHAILEAEEHNKYQGPASGSTQKRNKIKGGTGLRQPRASEALAELPSNSMQLPHALADGTAELEDMEADGAVLPIAPQPSTAASVESPKWVAGDGGGARNAATRSFRRSNSTTSSRGAIRRPHAAAVTRGRGRGIKVRGRAVTRGVGRSRGGGRNHPRGGRGLQRGSHSGANDV